MRFVQITFLSLIAAFLSVLPMHSQEINAHVTINRQQIQGTATGVFDNLETVIKQFLNERRWTSMQYKPHERIDCNFALTVSKYVENENRLECKLTVQSTRPVFNSNYTTPIFLTQDENVNFTFAEFDKLEFRPDVIDNDLTAILAYYVYLIIGLDMDSMSPLGGTEVLQTAQTIVNNAQGLTLSAKGWKAFEDKKNRYAIINDYLDSGMEVFRRMYYKYHREGMDTMAENAERGRAAVTDAIAMLRQARESKSMSMLPQIFSEIKRDELVDIYKGKGNAKDKESVFETMSSINPSQNGYWTRMKQ